MKSSVRIWDDRTQAQRLTALYDDIFQSVYPIGWDRIYADKNLNKALDMLPERDRNIVILRYGLNGELAHTYQNIGKRVYLSSARVSQLASKSVMKLRTPPFLKKFVQICEPLENIREIKLSDCSNISGYACKTLNHANIHTVGDVLNMDYNSLLAVDGMRTRYVREVTAAIKALMSK